MSHRVSERRLWIPLCGLCLIVSAGCGANRGTLPSTILVELPDGTTAEVDQGAGAASLADTQWAFFRAAGAQQGMAFVTINFGPDGSLQSFENNTIASDIFGSTLLFDGVQHSTTQPGFSYVASTYGAETSDGTGFAFEGRLAAFAAGIQAGTATATATGTLDPDDPNTMTGTFAFSTEITLPIEIPGAEVDDEFPFIAHRVVD